MVKQIDESYDRINKFYKYLEYRLELENSIEKQLLNDKLSIPFEINYNIKKKQPSPSSL